MREHLIDVVSRGLAQGISRRRLLKAALMALAGAAVPAVLPPTEIEAVPPCQFGTDCYGTLILTNTNRGNQHPGNGNQNPGTPPVNLVSRVTVCVGADWDVSRCTAHLQQLAPGNWKVRTNPGDVYACPHYYAACSKADVLINYDGPWPPNNSQGTCTSNASAPSAASAAAMPPQSMDTICCSEGDTQCGKGCCSPGEVCANHKLSLCCPSDSRVCGSSCCGPGNSCINNQTCCPSAQVCGSVCCPPGQACQNGSCQSGGCPSGCPTCNGQCCCSPGFCWFGVLCLG